MYDKILFVCTGNICRSPLAHAIFAHISAQQGCSKYFELESAGTYGYHYGENADERMRKTAQSHGVILDHHARKVVRADLEYYDLILAMGPDHADYLRRMADHHSKEKIRLFRTWDPAVELSKGIPEVPDPYYGGSAIFETVYVMVERTCKNLLVDRLQRIRKE